MANKTESPDTIGNSSYPTHIDLVKQYYGNIHARDVATPIVPTLRKATSIDPLPTFDTLSGSKQN
jgi:hypothetical protein